MSSLPYRILLASETPMLREVLLDAIKSLDYPVEIVPPDQLLEMEFSGFVLIFLETGDDVERLVATVRRLWDTWGEIRRADLQFLCYSPEELTTDEIVFRLGEIGPEMTAIVPTWKPERLPVIRMEAMSFTRRILKFFQEQDDTAD